jgi:hypothetical protein
LCPFGGFRAGWACREEGRVQVAPGWTNDWRPVLLPGSHWTRPGTAIGGMWGGAPRKQVVSLAGARLRSSLRGCPQLVAAGAWGGCTCGQRDQSDQAAARRWRGPVRPAITRCLRPGLLTPPSASRWPGRGPGRRASRRSPGEQLARCGDLGDVLSLLAAAGEDVLLPPAQRVAGGHVLDRFDQRPPHDRRPLLVMCARRTLVSDSRCRGVSPA